MKQQLPYKSAGQFGFSNDLNHLESVRQFRDAAIADGWESCGMYTSEPEHRASSLRRQDGGFWTMSCLTREMALGARWKCEANIHIWSPAGLAVAVPEYYSMDAIRANASTCPECRRVVAKLVRVGFCNPACEECAPALRKKIETPGWRN